MPLRLFIDAIVHDFKDEVIVNDEEMGPNFVQHAGGYSMMIGLDKHDRNEINHREAMLIPSILDPQSYKVVRIVEI